MNIIKESLYWKKYQLQILGSIFFFNSCRSGIEEFHINDAVYNDSVEITHTLDQLRHEYSPFFDYFNLKYFYDNETFYLCILGIGETYKFINYDSSSKFFENKSDKTQTTNEFIIIGSTEDMVVKNKTVFSSYIKENKYFKKYIPPGNKPDSVLIFSSGASTSNFLITDQNTVLLSDIGPSPLYNLIFYSNDTSLKTDFKELFVTPNTMLSDRFFDFDIHKNKIYYCNNRNVVYTYDMIRSSYDSIIFTHPTNFREKRENLPDNANKLTFEEVWKYKNDIIRGIDVVNDAIYLEYILFDRDSVNSSSKIILKLDHNGSTRDMIESEPFLHFDKRGNYFSIVIKDSTTLLRLRPLSDLFE